MIAVSLRGASALVLFLLLGSSAVAGAQDLVLPGRQVLSTDPFVLVPRRPPIPAAPGRRLTAAVPVWRGLRVEPESSCSELAPGDYGIAGGRRFVPFVFGAGSIEVRDPLTCSYPAPGLVGGSSQARLVMVEEAHRRGLCARSPAYRRLFVIDTGNVLPGRVSDMVLAQRVSRGPGWLPPLNQCWYAAARLRVLQRWGLSVPMEEVHRFQAILARCPALDRAEPGCSASTPPAGAGW